MNLHVEILQVLRVHVKNYLIMEKIAGEIIRNNRKRLGYTQDEIACVIDTSRPNYSKKERGEVPFTAGEFLRILYYFRHKGPKCLLPAKYQFFDTTL